MPMILSDEQEMLRETAAGFVAKEAPVAHLRALRDSDDHAGFSRDVWQKFAEMGLAGVMVPENHGGAGLGVSEAAIVLAEIGRNLSPSPFLSTAVGAASALGEASADIQAQWLPKLASGELVAALAIDEGRKHRPAKIEASARPDGNGYRLSGTKTAVPFGHSADKLIVASRTSGAPGETAGISLFLVDPQAEGVTASADRLVDSSMAATISLNEVRVDGDARLGEETTTFSRMLGVIRAGAAAELTGLAEGAATATLDYIRERKQFGVPVGAFQALQHRAAHLYAELEVAKAVARQAALSLDEGSERAAADVAVAKAMCGRVALLAVQEGVQMHGGVGMTDEYDIGLYMKRHRALEELYGDANFHTEEFARMNGY